MIRPWHNIVILVSIAALLAVCSKNPSDLSGGSGAGNPGGTVIVSLIADTMLPTDALQKIRAVQTDFSNGVFTARAMNGQGFSVRDDDSMLMIIDTAFVKVQKVHFIVSDSETPDVLIKDFPALSADSESIILKRSLTFELVSGATYPSLCSLNIPEAKYAGIKLKSFSGQGSNSGPSSSQTGYDVTLIGRFLYHDTVRSLKICLNLDAPFYFQNNGKEFSISRKDTTRFLVTLNARKWFVGLNLKSCIENGSIPLDSNGDLVLTAPPKSGPCKGAINSLRSNMLLNGVLKVY
jgi:hypothetical protein